MRVSAELRGQYEADGVVCLRQVLDHDWLDVVARSVERGRANPGPMFLDYSAGTKPGTYCTDMWIWPDNPEMKAFIFDSPVASIVGELMNVDSIMLVTDNWLVREAGAVNRAPWHHDDPYFDVGGKWCVLWMGLEPVGPGDGVVFLKGSHKWNRHFMPLSFAGAGAKGELIAPYEPTPDFSLELDRYDVIEYTLEPGDCVVFDSRTVHGAPDPKPATRTVRRLTMRYADGVSTFEKRGPWTDEQCAYLARFGHKQNERLAGQLLPVLWRRQQTHVA